MLCMNKIANKISCQRKKEKEQHFANSKPMRCVCVCVYISIRIYTYTHTQRHTHTLKDYPQATPPNLYFVFGHFWRQKLFCFT